MGAVVAAYAVGAVATVCAVARGLLYAGWGRGLLHTYRCEDYCIPGGYVMYVRRPLFAVERWLLHAQCCCLGDRGGG